MIHDGSPEEENLGAVVICNFKKVTIPKTLRMKESDAEQIHPQLVGEITESELLFRARSSRHSGRR